METRAATRDRWLLKQRSFLSRLVPSVGCQPSKSRAVKEQEEDGEISEDAWRWFPLPQKAVAILDGSALTEAVLAPPSAHHHGTNATGRVPVPLALLLSTKTSLVWKAAASWEDKTPEPHKPYRSQEPLPGSLATTQTPQTSLTLCRTLTFLH